MAFVQLQKPNLSLGRAFVGLQKPNQSFGWHLQGCKKIKCKNTV